MKKQVESLSLKLIEIRRRLHQCPEPGNGEYETGHLIQSYLEEFGIPFQTQVADTGIIATVTGTGHVKKGLPKTVAFRADMDALPILEPSSLSYCSKNPGFMHACGHDAHMAIALGTACLLQNNRNQFAGTARFFFQPAEETTGGAKRMIEAGCLKDPKPDAIFGLHVKPELPCGHIELKKGKLYAASDEIHITVLGKSCHAAYPEDGVDALYIMSVLITTLQSIVSRTISPLDSAVLSFGTIQGGLAHNILCEKVVIKGTLRTTSPAVRKQALFLIEQQTVKICSALEGIGKMELIPGYHALINDSELVDYIEETAKRILPPETISYKESPSLGVEDFSFFLEEIKGAFFHLGCGNPEQGITAQLHSPLFQLDEACLKTGVLLMTSLAFGILSDIE